MSNTKLFLLLLFLGSWWIPPPRALGQSVNLGDPPVQNFTKKDYKGGTQVWDIDQDSEGVTWFGNNEGLLEFDGRHWRLHPLSNHTIVRSVRTGSNGCVFVGGQDEFGYFAPGAKGILEYHSLIPRVPESMRHMGDVWNILVHPDGVFFRTNHQVFRWHGDTLTTAFPTGKALHFIGIWQKKVLVQDGELQLFIFENGHFQPLENPSEFRMGTISGILEYSSDTTLVTTIKNGIFYFDGRQFVPWKTTDDLFLKNNIIFCARMLRDGKIAVGTALNGLITLDRHRRIYHHLNKNNGLQNNTILSLLTTAKGMVWLGLDNGIDYVDILSPFTTIFPDGDFEGTGYAAQVNGGKLYFGTNTGLYMTDWKPFYAPTERKKFAMVKNSNGQVWSLTNIGGDLLMGHHEGPFWVKGNIAQKLTQLEGVWKFLPLSNGYALAGHYNGLALFQHTANSWGFVSVLEGLKESSRLLGKDQNGQIWMAHPYRGIFGLTIDLEQKSLKSEFFNSQQGLPTDLGNHLFQVGNNVVFTGEQGIFSFSPENGRFIADGNFQKYFGANTQVRYLSEDNEGNIWYATDKETGILKVETHALEKKVRRIPIPELANKLTVGFPFILPIDAQNVFVATDHGFIHLDLTAYHAQDSVLKLRIHEVRLKSGPDSLLYGGHNKPGAPLDEITLSANRNSLVFSFSATENPNSELVTYSHFLEGMDAEWSVWSGETDLIFNNIRPGNYTFHIKARDQYGVVSAVQSFTFKILPPWYASSWAFLGYFLLLIGAMVGVIWRQQRRFAKEKMGIETLHQHREELHQLRARHSEEAINQLKTEKLHAEIDHKNQELASTTLHILEKSEILNSTKSALEKLKGKASNIPELEKEIDRIILMLKHEAKTDDYWEQFSENFDLVHSDFLKRLREQYDDLSPNDYKLCAYLRLNLSSKEIATLMNISLRGVESSRYRLRKRMGLGNETNLTEFLIRF